VNSEDSRSAPTTELRPAELEASTGAADATLAHAPGNLTDGSIGDDTQELAPAADAGATAQFVPAPHTPKPKLVGMPSSSGHRFQILRPHAKGGLGLVSVAEDKELHREVALKEILQKHAGNLDSQARFVMEAEITGGLEHPGIVPVYGLGKYPDGRPFYAMRFIRGESLEDTVERFHQADEKRDPGARALELRQLIGRVIDVCQAIEYAHSRGILHRDIKPANIMLGKYGETLVVDWGIAKLMNQPESESVVDEGTLRPVSASDTAETQMGTTIGTPQYMSPEQATGRLDLLGPHSDVYSLGATLYFVLTGRPPFDADRVLELLKKVQVGDFRPPREVNKQVAKQLDAICRKAMALEPADRYQSARDLSNDLEHWLADEPVTAYQENLMERAVRWLRHHRSWAQASLFSLLAVTVVSTIAAVLVNQARRLEVSARKEAERQEALAIEAREESEQSFRHARQAVDEFFRRVSEETLLDVPGLQPLRRDLLQVALGYEQKFLEQRGNDPTLRNELASASFRVALVTAEIKSKEEALPLYDRARQIQEELLASEPASGKLRYKLSNTYNEIGRAHFIAARYDDALVWFRKSLELRERLVKDDPDDAEYQRKLASTYMNVGVLAKQTGQWDQALQDYGRANEIRQQLVAKEPTQPDYRRDLARGHYSLGVLALETQDFAQATQSLKQAAEGYEQLVEEFPLVTDHRQWLATCYRVLGDSLIRAGEIEEALTTLHKARDLQQRLARENPGLIELAADLASTYGNLAGLHESQGQFAEALGLVQQAVQVLSQLARTNPQDTRVRGYLATNLVRTAMLQTDFDDEAALDALQQAHDIYADICPRDSHNLLLRDGWGKCLINLGVVHQRLKELDLASRSLDQARAIYEELTHMHPENASFRDDLARCYSNLGSVQQARQDFDGALDWHFKARKIHEQLLESTMSSTQRDRLVETIFSIAQIESLRDRPDEALEAYTTAQKLAQESLDQDDKNPDAIALLARAHHGRGSILLSQEQHQESHAAYKEAVDLQLRALNGAPEAIAYRQNLSRYYGDLALVQREVGKTADAVATTLLRRDLWPDEPLELYNIGRDLAAMVPRGNELSDTEKMEQARYIELAIGILSQAKRAGYSDWQTAEKDDALAILRDQESFKKLLGDPR
jgi:serine/threonine protein kinase